MHGQSATWARRDTVAVRRLSHPLLVAVLVAAAFLAQAREVAHHPQRFDYVKMDTADARNGFGSSRTIDWAIRQGPVRRDGYDGQFFYFIALDPTGAAPYLGSPSYRYSRIGYPLVARAAALGNREHVRGALVAVNGLAIAVATFFAGLIFVRWRMSAWWSVLIATYPGLMLVAFTRDTSEPLAYALALAGLWLLVRAEPVSNLVALASGLVFAAAALTRETTLLMALPAAIAIARRHRTPALILATTAALPYLAWKTFLTLHFGSSGTGGIVTSLLPLNGVLSVRPWNADEWLVVLSVMLPVLVWIVLVTRSVVERRNPLVSLTVLANCGLLLFLSPAVFDGYGSTGRVATGAATASIIGFPTLRATWGRTVAFSALALWTLPWSLLMSLPAHRLG
jgi:hypothetical protein